MRLITAVIKPFKLDDVKAALEALGISKFLYVPGWDLHVFAFPDLFRPESVAANFRLEAKLTSGYLLTWRKPGSPPLPAEVMSAYRESYSKGRAGILSKLYPIWMERLGEKNTLEKRR